MSMYFNHGQPVTSLARTFTSLQNSVLGCLCTRETCYFVLEQDFLDMLFGFTVLSESDFQYPLTLQQTLQQSGIIIDGPLQDNYLQYAFNLIRTEIYRCVTLRKDVLTRLSANPKNPDLAAIESPLILFFCTIKPRLGALLHRVHNLHGDFTNDAFVSALAAGIGQFSLAPLDPKYFSALSSLELLQSASDALVQLQLGSSFAFSSPFYSYY